MIDNEINLNSAKFWCLFDDKMLQKIVSSMKKEATSNEVKSTEKEIVDNFNKKTLLNEDGFWQALKDFWNAPPAWVEEPTGFKQVDPEHVFKDDVKGGLEGYKQGQKIGAVAGLTMLGTAEAAMNPAAVLTALKTAAKAARQSVKIAGKTAKVAGKTAKFAGKTAKVAGKTAVAAELADWTLNNGNATKAAAKWSWDKIKDNCAPETKALLDNIEKLQIF